MTILNMLTIEHILTLLIPLLIIYKHKENIKRIIKKEENKLF